MFSPFLYKEIILQHDRSPFHYQKADNLSITIEAYNPVCGDQFKLFLNIEQEMVQEAYFHGYGCAISKASTSVLVKKIQGLPVQKVLSLLEQFLQLVDLQYDLTENPDTELNAFAAARQFPERLQCATLSWVALKEFFEK